jgi:hypothetical protein
LADVYKKKEEEQKSEQQQHGSKEEQDNKYKVGFKLVWINKCLLSE